MNKVIYVVDTQFDFMDPKGSLYIGKEAEGLADRISQYIVGRKNECGNSLKIFHTLDWHKPNDAEFKKFPEHCVEYTVGANSVLNNNALRFVDGFIEKNTYSPIGLHVDSNAKHEIAGVCTHLCVAHTAMHIYNLIRDWDPTQTPDITIYKDLIGDFNSTAAKQMLARLKEDCGVKIKTHF
jgi:nicotinamidase/pyrazinamidase